MLCHLQMSLHNLLGFGRAYGDGHHCLGSGELDGDADVSACRFRIRANLVGFIDQ
jgi:hypothetical protein